MKTLGTILILDEFIKGIYNEYRAKFREQRFGGVFGTFGALVCILSKFLSPPCKEGIFKLRNIFLFIELS